MRGKKKKSKLGRLFKLMLLGAAVFMGAIGYFQYKAARVDYPPLNISDSSVILASDGTTELGHIASTGKNHVSLTDEQVSPLLRHAHMAAEDRSFYTHGPFSWPGMIMAQVKNAMALSFDAGGSSITQQYVKNAYLTRKKTADRKIDEAILSYKVEGEFPKDQILTKFVNTNYYGRGAYGVDEAAQVWFGVPATEIRDMNDPLQVARAAFLASIIRKPSEHDDYEGRPSNLINSKALYERVNYTLDGLRDLEAVPNMVSPSVIAQAKQLLPLQLTDTLRPSGNTLDGDPYLADYARDWLTAWQVEAAKDDGYSDEEAEQRGTTAAEAMLARGGMRVVTTLDANLNRQLNEAVNARLPDRGLSAGGIVQDPRTGAIVAMYPGNNYEVDQYNYALYAERNVGSVMKAVVISDLVRNGISLKSELPAPPYIEVNGAKIDNDGPSPGNCKFSLDDAIAVSNNPVHIEEIIGQMASCDNPAELTPIEPNYPVSPASVAALARQMGADDSVVPGATNPAKLDEVPTLALGTSPLTLPQVSTIGSTLANGGVHTKPYLMVRIDNQDGTTIFEHKPETANHVLDIEDVNIINQALTGVFTYGTASGAQVPEHATAGKTGTDDSNAWGVMWNAVDSNNESPAFVCTMWAGYPDNRDSNGDLWGAEVMEICQHFMTSALADAPSVDFPPADLSTGRLVGLNAGGQVPETTATPAPETTSQDTSTSTPDEPTTTPSGGLPLVEIPLFEEPTTEPEPSTVPDEPAPPSYPW